MCWSRQKSGPHSKRALLTDIQTDIIGCGSLSQAVSVALLPWFRHAHKQTRREWCWVRWYGTVTTMRHWRAHKYRHSALLLHKAHKSQSNEKSGYNRFGVFFSSFLFHFYCHSITFVPFNVKSKLDLFISFLTISIVQKNHTQNRR